MNKYTELSDFEINLAVAHIALGKGSYDWCPDKKEVYFAGIDGGEFLHHGYFDPCNNPSDAMPIIIENEISMIKNSGGWMCCHGSVGQVEHESLYRGAMELFLMMKDTENNQ
ncbi:DUF2591 domain-containing protein [Proteus mirabilis]|uniref:phage protein NinX family protein n=1 Tax=Proteus mirabilis TaxID=584 RepID=UPI000F5C1014|nr:phage protein NinX family protein [Proteus mirabilis]AZH04394.1 DUF2591 domain-containing protein [Proteus mirabilis]